MNTIRDYLESLFLGVPESAKKEQLKTDLLANMEDRYNDLIEEGKGDHEAIGITITEFGSIDELLAELDITVNDEVEVEDWGRGINEEEAVGYLMAFRKSAIGIGTGVLLTLLGVASLIFFTGELMEDLLGLLIMFTLIAIAVGFFITSGLRISASGKNLDDRPIQRDVSEMVAKLKVDFQRSFALCIVLGVVLCVFSVGMIFLGGLFISEVSGVAMMLSMIGFGTFLLIYGGMVQSSFERFTKGKIFVADEDEMGPRAKAELKKTTNPFFRFVESFYWPAVVITFLIWGFVFNGWGISWIIFPIAGILYGGLENLFES